MLNPTRERIRTENERSKKSYRLEDLVQHDIVGDLTEVRGLNFSGNTNQFLAEGILRGSINHLGLNLGGVGGPL